MTFPSRCSTSRLTGANVTWVSDLPSFPLSSISKSRPPRSPSRNAVTTDFFDAISMSSGLIPEPIVAIAFLIPNFNSWRTSFRPSTIMSASLSLTLGPAVIPEISFSASSVKTARTSSKIFLDSSCPELTISSNNVFARPMTLSRLADTMFSIDVTLIMALHGPIRSIVSSAAPITAVLT